MKLESHDLGSIAIQDAVQRASVEPSEISQVIMGQASVFFVNHCIMFVFMKSIIVL